MQSVTLSLYRFGPLAARLWAFGQMATARFALKRQPEITFFKLCGSGTGEGFTPVPNTAVYAILATWPDIATARRVMETAPVFRNYARHSDEQCCFYLSASDVRGQWAGQIPFQTLAPDTHDGPIVSITRANIRPRIALKFWRRGPAISQAIGADPNVLFKIGIGELPWFRQVTFSVWPDRQSMAAFARADGPHAKAIRAVRSGNWFSEELYARFRIDAVTGTWEGAPPLSKTQETRDIAAE